MTLLVIEDHPVLRSRLMEHFTRAGFAVDAAPDGASARDYLDNRMYDVVILDLGLPDMDGIDLLARRDGGMQRCVILTARDALEDRVRGLDLGADDYVLKPFAMAELDARVRAVLRRPGSISSGILSCGRLHFDARARHASVEGRALPLSRREGMLLEELLRQSPRVVIKELLEERLYNYEEEVTPNAVEAVASRLRRKLLSAGADCHMETARGLGYRIVPSESSGERAPSQRRG